MAFDYRPVQNYDDVFLNTNLFVWSKSFSFPTSGHHYVVTEVSTIYTLLIPLYRINRAFRLYFRWETRKGHGKIYTLM